MTSPVAFARSFLFVPASRPERFAKAFGSGAGGVILDLEDAVAPGQKAVARARLESALARFEPADLARTLLRINAAGTSWHDDDVRLACEWFARGLAGVVVPKAQARSELEALAAALGPTARLVPLIESLAGLDAIDQIARARQVARLALGHLDFQLDLGMRCEMHEVELAPVRFALVAASRRECLPAPVDGVTVDTSDAEQVNRDASRARAFGFGAKLCIHPSQVPHVESCFAPSAAQLDWARRVLDAARSSHGAAFSLDGRMIDLPVVRLARQTLEAGGGPQPPAS